MRSAHLAALAAAALVAALVVQLTTVPLAIRLIEGLAGRSLSDQAIVRVHLALATAVAATAMFIVWARLPARSMRAKAMTFILLSGLAFSLATLLLDRADFLSEESKMTGATGGVLLLVAFAAYANHWARVRYDVSGTVVRVFWALLCAVFAAAALDELFMLHERVGDRLDRVLGRSGKGDAPARVTEMQDVLTLGYAVGGLVFAVLVALMLRRHAARRGSAFGAMLLAAAVLYLVSVSLDTFDWLLEGLDPTLDMHRLANSIEEVLELLAAGLFLSAFLAALLEVNGGFLLHRLAGLLDGASSGRRIKVRSYTAVGLLALAIGSIHAAPGRHEGVVGPSGQAALAVVSDRWSQPGLTPDGIAVAGGTLYAANDETASVTAFRPDGQVVTLANAAAGLSSPESIAVAPDGTVYVTDSAAGAVFAIRPDGSVTRILERSDGLRSPKGIALDPAGALHIADEEAKTVFRYGQGRLDRGTSFAGVGTPEELAFDRRGNLYVTQETPPRIYKVEPGAEPSVFADESGGLEAPESVRISDDRIYVADSRRGAVLRFAPSGVGSPVLQLTMPLGRNLEGLAVDEQGDLFVGLRRGRRSVVAKAAGTTERLGKTTE